MAKFFDTLAATFVIFLISFALSMFLTGKLLTSFLISFSIALVFNLAMQNIRIRKNDKKCSQDSLLRYFLKHGNETCVDILLRMLPPFLSPKAEKNRIVIENNTHTEVIYVNYKFGVTVPDDIVRFARDAEKLHAKIIYILGKAIDRRAISLSQSYPGTQFIFISHKKLYALLRKHGLLPELTKPDQKTNRTRLGTILQIALNRSNFKRYLLSGVMLALCSFIVFNLKIYYLCISCLCFVLALLCLTDIGKISKQGKNGIFDHLDDPK